MCGIFGLAINNGINFNNNSVIDLVNSLFLYSETRGKESAGIALHSGNSINVYKEAGSPSKFIKNTIYKKEFKKSIESYKENRKSKDFSFSLIGHSRLVTNGLQYKEVNNQPVVIENLVGIHNGIITNEEELWANNNKLKKEFEVDSEILLKLIDINLENEGSLEKAANNTFNAIEGSASVATYFSKSTYLLLATNTGSIFYINDLQNSFFIFASERFILKKLVQSGKLRKFSNSLKIKQLKAFKGLKVNLKNLESKLFNINDFEINEDNNVQNNNRRIVINDCSRSPKNIKRCKKCILPVTYPFMDLDENGVCRYCRRHKPFQVSGELKLFEEVEKYRSKDGSPDCIVALSGGRDSCYGLHYIKKVLGMNPIAFTYDWGLVTDLARRNCARLCGKLGVEHIIRTPNIALKRKYVRKNVEAWLKKPELGMIPLFMAGDKAFYHFARQIRKETGIKLVIFCTGNMIENTPYKFGFSGLRDGESNNILTRIKVKDKLKLIYYYTKNFLLNPSYFNSSIFDTASAYWHTFVRKDDFLYLYRYLEWNEEKIVDCIINNYDWEISKDTKTTWRIGDGTAAFYNYIYYTMAGFTEDDDMLSNMVRENYITRETALERSIEFSKPRIASMEEYAQMIGINLEETLSIINNAQKRY